jgi:hypothetical protein
MLVSMAGFPEFELRQPRQVGDRISDGDTSLGERAGIAISSVTSGVGDICASRRGRDNPKAGLRSARSSGRAIHFASGAVPISPLFEHKPANPDEAEGPDQHGNQLGRVKDIAMGSEHSDNMVPFYRQLDLRGRKADPDEVECSSEIEKKVESARKG